MNTPELDALIARRDAAQKRATDLLEEASKLLSTLTPTGRAPKELHTLQLRAMVAMHEYNTCAVMVQTRLNLMIGDTFAKKAAR